MIFDLLLKEKQIQFLPNHTIPSAEDSRREKYCKWHNSVSHNTNECKVFCQQIQSAIEQGRIKFEDNKKPMKIVGHPFPINMVEIDNKLKSKVLISARAKESRAVDPDVQITADELRARSHHQAESRYEHWESSRAHGAPRVTS